MRLFLKICLKLVLSLVVLASTDSKYVESQERPEFEAATEPAEIAQVSGEIDLLQPMPLVQAPRIIFLPADSLPIDLEREGYEIRFESIEGSEKKRIKLLVPTSVAEIEISHGTRMQKEKTGEIGTNQAESQMQNQAPLPHRLGVAEVTQKLSKPGITVPPSGIPFSNQGRLMPAHAQVTSSIRNPYFFNRERVELNELKHSEVKPEYVSTPYSKINEILTDEPTIAEQEKKPAAEKKQGPVQARITDFTEFK